MVIAIFSALGLTTKFFAVPAMKVTDDPDKTKFDGERLRLYVFALSVELKVVFIEIVPVRPPELRLILLCPAVKLCAELNEERDDGK